MACSRLPAGNSRSPRCCDQRSISHRNIRRCSIFGKVAAWLIPVRYTDIRESAKITFRQDTTQTEEKYYLETMGTGVVTEKAGGGEGHYGQGVAVGDYDNDGYPDLYVTGYGRAILYHNNGNGTFTDVTTKSGVADEGGWSTSAGWFDYDKDGWLDLVVTNYIEDAEEQYLVRRTPARLPVVLSSRKLQRTAY